MVYFPMYIIDSVVHIVNFLEGLYRSKLLLLVYNPQSESLYRSVYMLFLLLRELKGGKYYDGWKSATNYYP